MEALILNPIIPNVWLMTARIIPPGLVQFAQIVTVVFILVKMETLGTNILRLD